MDSQEKTKESVGLDCRHTGPGKMLYIVSLGANESPHSLAAMPMHVIDDCQLINM